MTAGESATKHAPTPMSYLNERLTISQLVQRLETLHFDSHEQARVMLDPGIQNFLIRAAKAAAADHLDQKVRHTWRLIKPR